MRITAGSERQRDNVKGRFKAYRAGLLDCALCRDGRSAAQILPAGMPFFKANRSPPSPGSCAPRCGHGPHRLPCKQCRLRPAPRPRRTPSPPRGACPGCPEERARMCSSHGRDSRCDGLLRAHCFNRHDRPFYVLPSTAITPRRPPSIWATLATAGTPLLARAIAPEGFDRLAAVTGNAPSLGRS